jgi:DNA-directed RNA polymerase subunit RPC12/RpoP
MIGPLFCSTCNGTELTTATRPRCAHCGSRRILTAGTLRALIRDYKRGKLRDRLGDAVRRLLLESGASWPGSV